MYIYLNNKPIIQTNFNFEAKKLTPTQIKKVERSKIILKMNAEGFSNNQIAKKLQISRETVRNFLKAQNILPATAARKERILKMLQEGQTIENIMEQEKVDSWVVEYIAYQSKIKIIRESRKKKDIRNQTIYELLLNGHKMKDIAEKLKTSLDLVFRISQKMGKPQKKAKENRFFRIVEMLKNGMSYKDISQQEGISSYTIKRIKKEALKQGLIKELSASEIEKRVVNKIIALKSIEEIKQTERIPKTEILKIAKKYNLQPLTEYKKQKYKINDIILQKLSQDPTCENIIEKFNINKQKVFSIANNKSIFRNVLNERIKRVQNSFNSGASIEDLAKQENVCERTILRYLKRTIE